METSGEGRVQNIGAVAADQNRTHQATDTKLQKISDRLQPAEHTEASAATASTRYP